MPADPLPGYPGVTYDDYNDLVNSEEPDYDWLLPGLLERGDRMIITGGEGKGKSTFQRQIGTQASLGIVPFTEEQMPPLRVLFMDLENPRRTTRREIKKLGSFIMPAGRMTIVSAPGGMDVLEPAGSEFMATLLKVCQPELLLIGPMYKMTSRPLEKEEHSKALASLIDTWRVTYNFAVILESHQPHGSYLPDGAKGNRFMRPERPVGSSLWMRWPEFGFCLEDGGILRPWRGARDAERTWPTKLHRDGEWPWSVPSAACRQCQGSLPGGRLRYCSDRCKNAYNQSTHRARVLQGGLGGL